MEIQTKKFAVNNTNASEFAISKDGRYLLFSDTGYNLFLYDCKTTKKRNIGEVGQGLTFSEDGTEFLFTTTGKKSVLVLGSVKHNALMSLNKTVIPSAAYILKDKIIYIQKDNVAIWDRNSKVLDHSPRIGNIYAQTYCHPNLTMHPDGTDYFVQENIETQKQIKIKPFSDKKDLDVLFMAATNSGKQFAWCSATTNEVYQWEAGHTTTIQKDKFPEFPNNYEQNIVGMRYHENNLLQLAHLNEKRHTVLSLWNKDRCLGTQTLEESIEPLHFCNNGIVGLSNGGICHYSHTLQAFHPKEMEF